MGTAQQLLIYGDAGAASDPDWADVWILCHFDSSSGSPRAYVNESSLGTSIQNGFGTVPDTSSAQSKFGGFSLAYAASGNSRTYSSTAGYYNPGTGDFTEEIWARIGSASGTYNLLDCRNTPSTAAAYAVYLNGGATSGQIAYYVNGANRITSAGGVIVANTWQHIAICRSGGTSRLFVDGTQVGSDYTDSNNFNGAGAKTIGAAYNGANPAISSYFDEWRFTLAARYTSNFTAPTAAFPDS